jgi:GT2 family glycosyltransferase
MSEGPLISVLIVNYNSTALLCDCLEALRASSLAERLETIVVDNGSRDFDAGTMAKRFPEVHWRPQPRNLGFTAGTNLAYEWSTAPHILLLNPDTRVERAALERAVAHLDARDDLSALGAYLIGPDGLLQRYYRRLPSLRDLPVILFERILRDTSRGRRYLMLDEDFEGETPVPQPPGAFLLLRRSAVGAVLLDPGYFNFVSDLELCDRLNRAGHVAVISDVRCHHQRAGAGVGTRDVRQRLRLYHDFTWGIRRYFAPRCNVIQRVAMEAMLVAYWVTRIGMVARRTPSAVLRAPRVAAAALSGTPPRY